jgi:hypothetical protein
VYQVTAVFYLRWLHVRLRLVQLLPRLLLQGAVVLVAQLPSAYLLNPVKISWLGYGVALCDNAKSALAVVNDTSAGNDNAPTVDLVLGQSNVAKANEPMDPNHPSNLSIFQSECDAGPDYERLMFVRCDEVMARTRAKLIASHLGLLPPLALHKKYFAARPRSPQIWRHCYEIRLRLLVQVGVTKSWFGVEASGWTRCSSNKLRMNRVFPFVIVLDRERIKRRPLFVFWASGMYFSPPRSSTHPFPRGSRFHSARGSSRHRSIL